MKGVNDVLQGSTTMLQQTDVGVLTTALPYKNVPGNAEYVSQVLPLDSSNSNLTAQAAVAAGQSGNVNSYSPQSVLSSSASGRMFNNGNDVIMTLGVGECGSSMLGWKYHYFNPATNSNQSYCLKQALQSNGSTVNTKVVMGNFQGDNLVLPLMFAESIFGKGALWQMNIVTASINNVDVIDYTGGQPVVSEDDADGNYPIGSTLVTGDFNNDGIDELAVLNSDYQTIRLFQVTLPALTIAQYQTIKLPHRLTSGTLAAGRFGSSGKVYLAAVGQSTGTTEMTVDFIDATTSTPTVVPTTFAVGGLNSSQFHTAFAQAAPVVNWSGSSIQQLVLGLSYENNSWHTIEIGTFDTTRSFHVQGEEGQNGCLFGMQAGNYNNQTPSSSSTGFPGNVNPNLQIVELQSDRPDSDCNPPYADNYIHLTVDNISVPPDVQSNPQSSNPPAPTNWFTQASDVVPNIGPYNQLTDVTLLTGDFQGRSLRLGAPEKITLTSHMQPDLVLGMPPMHVDWVNPSNLGTDECEPNTSETGKSQCVVNLTAKPYGVSTDVTTGFTSSFTTANTNASTSSRKSTTSWGVAVKQTEGIKAKYKIPDVGSVSGSVKTSISNSYQNVHSQYDSQYKKSTEALSTYTAFDDQIYYTIENQNIFSYPILGQEDGNGNPLYAIYSVPSQVVTTLNEAATQEWYQPIHEPGNVLSYPSSEAMLQNEYTPGSTDLKSSKTCIVVSGNTASTLVEWDGQTSDTTSAGFTDALSGDLKVSVSAKVDASVLTGGVGGKFFGSVDVSGSGAWSTLNQNSTVTTSSNALAIAEPQFDKTSKFGYAYESLVFGYSNANPPYQNPSSLLPAKLDVKTAGPLYAGFIANPVSTAPGLQCGQPEVAWWPNVYTKPDVGFNHPLRWDVSTDNQATFNKFHKPSADHAILDQSFYQMKGMFITTAPSDTGTPGSIVQSVQEGNSVKLTARVYNFSLVSTNALVADSTVHVRFYGQKRCSLPNNGVTYPDGTVTDLCPNAAFLIPSAQPGGDVVLPPIVGFNESSPNWSLASVNFDTSGHGDQKLIFWAVTWIQDANGKVVSEMAGHGVSETSFEGKTFQNISDIALENHSNNVGMYGTYTPFYVIPAAGNTQADAEPLAVQSASGVSGKEVAITAASEEGSLSAIHIVLQSHTLPLDKKSKVQVTLSADKSFPGSTIRYYDGNPASGGKLFDLQTLHPMPSNSSDTERVFFRPERCGSHTLYAVSDLEGFPETIGQISATVKLDASKEVSEMRRYIDGTELKQEVKATLIASLESAQDRFVSGSEEKGLEALKDFEGLVQRLAKQRDTRLTDQEDTLIADAHLVQSCENDLRAEKR